MNDVDRIENQAIQDMVDNIIKQAQDIMLTEVNINDQGWANRSPFPRKDLNTWRGLQIVKFLQPKTTFSPWWYQFSSKFETRSDFLQTILKFHGKLRRNLFFFLFSHRKSYEGSFCQILDPPPSFLKTIVCILFVRQILILKISLSFIFLLVYG
jgi:hypothetical protein